MTNVTIAYRFVSGTPFMNLLAESLRYWVAQKMNSDPGWKNVKKSSCLSLVQYPTHRFETDAGYII